MSSIYHQNPAIFFDNLSLVPQNSANMCKAVFALKQAQWGLIYLLNAGQLDNDEYAWWSRGFHNMAIG